MCALLRVPEGLTARTVESVHTKITCQSVSAGRVGWDHNATSKIIATKILHTVPTEENVDIPKANQFVIAPSDITVKSAYARDQTWSPRTHVWQELIVPRRQSLNFTRKLKMDVRMSADVLKSKITKS
jgi:hypothetical protein